MRPGLYAELLASFLSHQHKLNDPSKFGGKLSLEHKSPLGSSLFCDPPFIELANFLISSSFLKTVFSLITNSDSNFRPHIYRPYSALKPLCLPTLLETLFHPASSLLGLPISITLRLKITSLATNFAYAFNCLPFVPRMQFSIMPKNSFIPPHTDIANKIITIFFIFPLMISRSNPHLAPPFGPLRLTNRLCLNLRVGY